MKSNIAIFCLLLIAGKVNALEMSPQITAYLQEATLSETGYPSGTPEQVTDFTNFVKTNWSAILTEIDTVAPDERRQKLVMAAAEWCSGVNYVSFLSGLLDKYQANKVKKSVAIDAMSPGLKKIGFLSYDYQHPTVAALCQRAKTLFADNAELQSLMTDVLSGAQRKQDGAVIAMDSLAQPEILPVP
jgi:hypothetical protein